MWDILVVDDNPESLQLIFNILSNAGYHVRPAPEGSIALRSVEFEPPDLILLDIRMPDMDGYEVCRRLKSNEKNRDIPVIFISGLGETTQRVQGFNAGGVDYITKPFETEEVLARVDTHLRLRELTLQLEKKVKERTEELVNANEKLQKEISVRKEAEQNLVLLNATINKDIIERKKTEETLRRERTLLSQITETSPVGITMVSRNGEVTFANKQAENLFKLRKDEIAKLAYNAPQWHITDFNGGAFPDEKLPFSQVISTGKSVYNIQHAIEWPDGKRRYLSINGAPIINDIGDIDSVVLTIDDITERKLAEDALRGSETRLKMLNDELKTTIEKLASANKELESFSYSVAHDLRNPLKVVSGLTDFLIEDYAEILDQEGKSFLDKIKNGTQRMNSIIDDMLLLSKISRQEIEIVELDLSEMARLAIKELYSVTPERKVCVKIQDGLKARVDARLMSVTLGNLLGNAWKYTEKTDCPEIEFGAFKKDGQRIYYVKDNGIGFDMNQAEKLFVPFQRLHSEKEFKGIGVGLAIVERAISRLGGKIWAQGEVGHGAQFNFTIATHNVES